MSERVFRILEAMAPTSVDGPSVMPMFSVRRVSLSESIKRVAVDDYICSLRKTQ